MQELRVGYQRGKEDGTIRFVSPARVAEAPQYFIEHLVAESRYLELSNWFTEIDKSRAQT